MPDGGYEWEAMRTEPTETHSFSSSAHQEGELVSATLGDREVAFPHLNPSGLERTARAEGSQGSTKAGDLLSGGREALAAPTGLFVTSGHWAHEPLRSREM